MSTATYFFVEDRLGIMQCTALAPSATCETRQSPTIETAVPPARRAALACIQFGPVRAGRLTRGKSPLYYTYMK